jgi:YbgC/YbaW family acyl-CoA thioester hydrolase
VSRSAPARSPDRRCRSTRPSPQPELGFGRAFDNSLDAVGSRDHIAEALFAITMVAIDLSRLGEEWVLWTTEEFGFARLDDRFSTGSSMLPQKKNPDIAELARGKAGRVIGDLTGFLATIKGLPFSYNRDLQEDKEPLFDAVDQVRLALGAITGMIETATFDLDRMRAAADSETSAATDLAEWLVERGTPFRDAHATVGALVRRALAGRRRSAHSSPVTRPSAPRRRHSSPRRLGHEAHVARFGGAGCARRAAPGARGGADAMAGARRLVTYRHTVRVRYGECDMQRVVFNAHYFAYCDDAVDTWFRAVLAPAGGSFEDIGFDFMLKKGRAHWHAPLVFGETAELDCSVVAVGEHELRRDGGGAPTGARGSTRHHLREHGAAREPTAAGAAAVRAALDASAGR